VEDLSIGSWPPAPAPRRLTCALALAALAAVSVVVAVSSRLCFPPANRHRSTPRRGESFHDISPHPAPMLRRQLAVTRTPRLHAWLPLRSPIVQRGDLLVLRDTSPAVNTSSIAIVIGAVIPV